METLPSVRKCSTESMICRRIIRRTLDNISDLSCLWRFTIFEPFFKFFVDSFSHRFIWIPPSLPVLDRLLFSFPREIQLTFGKLICLLPGNRGFGLRNARRSMAIGIQLQLSISCRQLGTRSSGSKWWCVFKGQLRLLKSCSWPWLVESRDWLTRLEFVYVSQNWNQFH